MRKDLVISPYLNRKFRIVESVNPGSTDELTKEDVLFLKDQLKNKAKFIADIKKQEIIIKIEDNTYQILKQVRKDKFVLLSQIKLSNKTYPGRKFIYDKGHVFSLAHLTDNTEVFFEQIENKEDEPQFVMWHKDKTFGTFDAEVIKPLIEYCFIQK